MLRFALRFLGIWVFAAALVMAVVDGAKSIAASALVTTPVADVLAALAARPATAAAPDGLPWPLDVAAAWFLAAPACAILAFLGVGLLIVGRRRRMPQHLFVT